jgi:hypothetical protein
MSRRFIIADTHIRRGESRDLRLKVSENFTGDDLFVPIRVIRGRKDGPRLFVTAAVHGDEINGIGIIRELMYGESLELHAGTLVLLPIVNIFGFENHTRYMPDRRDLNRCFPGNANGSLARRMARIIFEKVISRCDCGIDLHSAALRRTNFPNVRGDLADARVRRLAKAFGCELMVSGKGPVGSLRRTACDAGRPTITVEAGEPWKIEPSVMELGLRGIRNVLSELGLIDLPPIRPVYQTRVDRTRWIRAGVGGILRFHVSPGQVIEANQPVATNASVFGKEQSVVVSPLDGIVLGMTTMPMAKPGEPVCHVAIPKMSVTTIKRRLDGASRRTLGQRVRHDLATNISVSDFRS